PFAMLCLGGPTRTCEHASRLVAAHPADQCASRTLKLKISMDLCRGRNGGSHTFPSSAGPLRVPKCGDCGRVGVASAVGERLSVQPEIRESPRLRGWERLRPTSFWHQKHFSPCSAVSDSRTPLRIRTG